MGSRPQIGLVGCGAWGRLILRDLDALCCDVHVVARSNQSRGRAHNGRAASVVYRVDQLPRVQAVVVATPTIAHGTTLESLLSREVPLFVESPLCIDAAEAESLLARAGDRLFVMDKWRYHPGVIALRDLARRGELGPVQGVATRRQRKGSSHSDVDAVWTLLPHDLSIALEILGELPEARHAVASGHDGWLWSLTGVLGENPFVSIDVCSRSPRLQREIRVIGRDGVAILEDGAAESLLILWEKKGSPNGPDEERRPFSGEAPLHAELRTFLEHLHGGRAPRSSAKDGTAIVRRTEELRRLAIRASSGSFRRAAAPSA